MITRVGCGAITALLALLWVSATIGAQGGGGRGGAPRAFDAHDISGFWGLSFDSRKVPQPKLLPRVTKAMIDLHARRDVHAMRWCNLLGTPFTMDSGTPIDIRQGPTTIIVAPENSPAPR